jgi:hypothetical protein
MMPAKNRTRVSARPQDFHRPLRLLQHGAVGRILEGVETFHPHLPAGGPVFCNERLILIRPGSAKLTTGNFLHAGSGGDYET